MRPRSLRLPAVLSRGLDLVVAALVPVAVVRWWWDDAGWPGLLLAVVAFAAVSLFWPLPVPDDEGCEQCEHAHAHHHGNCQECLREVDRGVRLRTVVPCARFRRWSPRNRWVALRTSRPSRRDAG